MTAKELSRLLICFVPLAGLLSDSVELGAQARAAAPALEPPQVAAAEIGLSQPRLDVITRMLEEEVRSGRIPGAVVMLARHGRVGYQQAIGWRDIEGDLPMRTDTLFRIASMSKSITSTGVMMLIEEGRLALDDPISKYLPEFKDCHVLATLDGDDVSTVSAVRGPTVRDMLTHTSGLTYGWFGPEKLDAIYRREEISDLFLPIQETIAARVNRIARVPLKFQPGTSWDYGVSTDVLGRVIEVVSGLTLRQFFQERIFRPLRMSDTDFYLSGDEEKRLAALYTPDEKRVLRRVGSSPVTQGFLTFSADYCLGEEGPFYSGGGGLVSTAADYLRFLQMLAHDGEFEGVRLLQSETVAAMTKNQIGELKISLAGHGDGFGFGCGVLTDLGASRDVASAGTFSWGGIFNTYFWVDPQEELIGILMTQLYPYDHLQLRNEFKRLSYESIDDSGFERVYWYEQGAEHANPHFNQRQLRVNSPEASIHPKYSSRSEPQSSGMARILVEEDLLAIRRADLYCEIWGGHPGTQKKRVSINGRSLHWIPEVGSAQRHCTHQYPRFNLRPMDLVNGYNSLQFACDQGDTFWGHYIVDNAALRIGVNRQDARIRAADLADFAVTVDAEAQRGSEKFTLRLRGTPEQLAAISAVHYQGKYRGFDENGNNRQSDWHGMTKLKEPYGMLGSSHEPPFRLSWNTEMLPAQERVAVRAIVEFSDLPNTVYRTRPLQGLAIVKPHSEQVTFYRVQELPRAYWSRAARRVQCDMDLDLDPADIVAAQLHVVAWTGGAGSVTDYFTINGVHFPIAEGSDHSVVYSRLPLSPERLRRGLNRIVLRSDTDHHGVEIMRPGPVLAVRHRQRGATRAVRADEATTEETAKLAALERFALTADGDPQRGRRLFVDDQRTKCAVCHRVGGQGGDVGPDLSKIAGKFGRPHLIESLLEPSRQIVEGFRTTVISTSDGKVHTGVVRSRSEQGVTLLDVDNKSHTFPRSAIEELQETAVSIMPEGVAEKLSRQEFADLIVYLETLRTGPAKFGADVAGPIQIPEGFEISTIATGLTGATAFEVLPDGRLLVCEQPGTLRVVQNGKLVPRPFLTVPVESYWERGLIGVTVAPDFPQDPYVYVVYVAATPYPHHRISRFRAKGNVAVPGSEEILLRGDDQRQLGGTVPAGHQGGAIHFGNDGKLYIGIGEQTANMPAQKLDTFQGKLLRINPDGSIPADNPYIGQAAGKYRAIWAIGCRNPFTFAVQRSSGVMLINDVGGVNEEINRGLAGANYGWPVVEHGPAERNGSVGAIHFYPQASISGGDFSPADLAWPPAYRNKYFFADFVHGWIKKLDPDSPATADSFASGLRRPVDLRFSSDGALYVLLRNAWVIDDKFEEGTSSLLRIRPQSM